MKIEISSTTKKEVEIDIPSYYQKVMSLLQGGF